MEDINLLQKRKRTDSFDDKDNWIDFKITYGKNKINSYKPLEQREIESKYDLLKNKPIKEIINKNNIDSDIIISYLTKYSKYTKNINYLKEALKNEHYDKLFKDKRKNPFTLIIDFLENIVNKKSNDKILKNCIFIGYNMPLIYGVERVRMNHYLYLFAKKKIKYDAIFAKDLSKFNYFFKYLKKSNAEDICNENKLNVLFYQFILELTEVVYSRNIYINNIPNIYNKINTDFIELKDLPKNTLVGEITKEINDSYLIKLSNNDYKVSNGNEILNIKEKNYNLEKLSEDIKKYPFYPLNILLYRNESLEFYYSKNKNYIENENEKIFKSFKSYFFTFIKSKSFMEIFSTPQYKNVKEFINNKNAEKILLKDCYLKFIPFTTNLYSGFTNKDILLSVINAYPCIVENLSQKYVKEKYQDIKNFCFLMSIGEKFLTLLHEHSIHFIFGYLFHLTKIKGIEDSPKRTVKNKNKGKHEDLLNDGGHFFEREFFGQYISRLKITNVIALLDGESVKSTNNNFREIFNQEFNKKKLLKKINNCSGFLKVFIEEYPIDFNYIFNLIELKNDPFISARGEKEPYIEIPENNKNNCISCIDYFFETSLEKEEDEK